MALSRILMSLYDHVQIGTSEVTGFSSGGCIISTEEKIMLCILTGRHSNFQPSQTLIGFLICTCVNSFLSITEPGSWLQ
jgi:hypothetical protein